MISAYENAIKQMKNALDIFDKDNTSFLEVMKYPKRVLEVNIPVKMDSGEVKMFKGFRSQHNDSKWPFKWWIRFHQDVSKDEVMALSIWMSIKTSVLDLPLWGGKGWIIVNPKELSNWEIERLSRGYVKWLYKYIWPGVDVPAPDVNTTPKIMALMADEYSTLVGKNSFGSFTGKPLTSGGSKWRGEATAQGWVYSLLKILELKWDKLEGKSVAIEWAWNAWLTMAKLVTELGAKVVAISDSRGWIYVKDGLDIAKVSELKLNRKSVVEYEWAEKINWNKIVELDVDILVPAALENTITIENASNVKAKLIVELANWPTTPEADEVLENKWISIIPDILANAWGVTVSYFEQVQNDANYYWSEEEVAERLKVKMDIATEGVYETAKKYDVSYRKAAYIVAMERIKNAMEDRWEI